MNVPIKTAANLGMGLTVTAMVLSFLAGLARGGFRAGKLERSIRVEVDRDQLKGFVEALCQRAASLGFQDGQAAGQFIQGGAGDDLSFTHAKTPKELRVTMNEQSQPPTVDLSLRYLESIVADSGESAYRDAVLDYVSGKTPAMQVVSNRSFSAFSSLVGGILLCVAFVVLKVIDFDPLWPAMVVPAAAYIGSGLFGIVTILRRPAEVHGTWLAIAGITLSSLAAVCSYIL